MLQALLSSPDASGVSELAREVSLHPNSVRFHLDALVSAGYASRENESRSSQGRPRVVYRATRTAPDVTSTHLRNLLTVLVDDVIARMPEPAAVAEEAGERWGRESVPAGVTAPVDAFVQHANDLGFAASVVDDQVRFARCPYRVSDEDTAAHPICAVHLGMMRGFLAASGAEVTTGPLERSLGTCVASLRPLAPAKAGE